MKVAVSMMALYLLSVIGAFAQDPGMQDSIIIETVYVDSGEAFADVRMYAVTDDSVAFYNMPLVWASADTGIYPVDVTYYNTLLLWDDTYHQILYSEGYIRMLGWHDANGDDNPPLITDYNRLHCWTVRYAIEPNASPQVVVIDTTYDEINCSVIFGLVGGTVELTPAIVTGYIYYGNPLEISDGDNAAPASYDLLGNYPNPFNTTTTINFALPEASHVSIKIYDLLGRSVIILLDTDMPAGYHQVIWDAKDRSSGTYFYRVQAGKFTETRKMVLLK